MNVGDLVRDKATKALCIILEKDIVFKPAGGETEFHWDYRIALEGSDALADKDELEEI